MSDDDGMISHVFGLSLELRGDDHLNITLSEVPRKHIPHMFSTSIADVITTSLMDMDMMDMESDDDDDEDDE